MNERQIKNIKSLMLSYNLGNLEISKGGYFQEYLNLLMTYFCENEELKNGKSRQN